MHYWPNLQTAKFNIMQFYSARPYLPEYAVYLFTKNSNKNTLDSENHVSHLYL